MKASLNAAGNRIVIKTTSFAEEKKLKEFPALYKSTMPLNPKVVDFVAARLKKAFKQGIGTDKSVIDRLNEVRQFQDQEVQYHPDFYFHTKPLALQEFALKKAIAAVNIGLLLDPGLGKTKTTLDYIFHLKCELGTGFTKAIIVCPKALVRTWYKEAQKHRPELKVHVVESVSHRTSMAYLQEKIDAGAWDPGKTRWAVRQIEKLKNELAIENARFNEADVIVLNYSKVTMAIERLVKFPWSVCAVDEALIKDPSTERTKAVLKLGKSCYSRLLLSGTLINQGPEDVFAPTQFLEPAIFGTSFYNFNQHYGIFSKAKENKTAFLIKYRDNQREEIRKGLELVSIVMSKDEWLQDLPKKADPVFFDVDMSPEQQRCYDELVSNYVTTLPNGEVLEVDNALSCLCKLQQIASGFVYFEETFDDIVDLGMATGKEKKEKGPRQVFFFDSNAKNDALAGFLSRPDMASRRIVLWYNTGGELTQIEKVLSDLQVNYVVVNGKTKDSGLVVDEFNLNPDIRVFVAQAKSVNYGVTLLGTDIDELDDIPELDPEVFTEYFYSVNYSLEVFLQQLDRVHRIGVKCSPEYYFSRVRNSVETSIYDALQKKQLIRKEFLIDVVFQNRQNIAVNQDAYG